MSELTNELKTAQTWIQKHERILIIVFCLIFGYFLLDKGLGIVSSYESHKADQANATLALQKSQNDAALAQAKATLADYETALANSVKENAALSAAISARDKVVVVQQQADAKLPPSQLATKWTGLIGDSGVESTPSGFSVTSSAGLATVQSLELVPVLKQDLVDETSKATNLQTDVDKANTLIDQGKIVVNGLQLQLTDQSKACILQVNAEKAAARKGKLKAFSIGFVAGFVVGQVGHAFGF
jgi:ribosomal protein L9